MNKYLIYDVVLNMADGAIGYLEDEEENLKIFDAVENFLKAYKEKLWRLENSNMFRTVALFNLR